jgi:roadblock/LC7 domain-containing protein
MQKLSEIEKKKVLAAGEIVDKQLQYFRIRDSKIAVIQCGLVQAVNGLSAMIVEAYGKRTRPDPHFNGGSLHP